MDVVVAHELTQRADLFVSAGTEVGSRQHAFIE